MNTFSRDYTYPVAEMGFMVHVCAGLLLVELGAADPVSHVNAVSIEKVKGVDSLNIPLVALVGFGVCRNASLKNKERRELCNELSVTFRWH